MPQAHTFLGTRGDTVCTLTIKELYRIVEDRVTFMGRNPDATAVAQRFCVEVEQHMGIFPNVPPIAPLNFKLGDDR